MRTEQRKWVASVMLIAVMIGPILLVHAADPAPAGSAVENDPNNAQWAITLVGFFPGTSKNSNEPKRLNCYLVRRNGEWTSALATPTNNGRPVWNTAIMIVEPGKTSFQDNRLNGTLSVTLIPDPWVPKDQITRTPTVTIDAALKPAAPGGKGFASLSGSWKADIPGAATELQEAGLQGHGEGEIIGSVGPIQPIELADESYDLALYNLIPGQTKDNFQRRRALSLGVKGTKVISGRLGQMDMRHNAFDFEEFETPANFVMKPDSFSGTVTFEADTLDGGRARFELSLQGRRVSAFLTGTWKGTMTLDDGARKEVQGYFRGNVRPGAHESTAARDVRPWFAAVPGYQRPGADEHPRLFFRKADVPELRRRAVTPDGHKIVQRLRELLNGSDGETLPTSYNPAQQAYEKNNFKAQPGTYTISHATGYGFLYQLTGERKYADLARQCVEKAWAGQRSGDDRYAWVAPGGELRAGPSIAWYAVAYDLCFDAWPADFRQQVALAIQNYADVKGGEWNNPEAITLRKMIFTPKQGPGSNHFGAVVGGCGLAVLAIAGDSGTDDALLKKYVEALERQVVRHLSAGWGDGGYYKEGWGASRVGTQGGFLCFLQALRLALGHDYLNVERPNASAITMVPRSLLLLRGNDHAYFPYRSNMGGTYGNPEIGSKEENSGLSHGGYFSEGFGAVADRYRPGLLWTYRHVFDPRNQFNFDTASPYPHRAMLALINWPTFAGIEEENPVKALPLVQRDHLYEHIAFRNGFHGSDQDIVTTVLINYPDGTRPRDVLVWGLGNLRLNFGEPRKAPVKPFMAGRDGSGIVAAGDWSLAVDYSGTSGADALLAAVGGSEPKGDLKSDKAKLTKLRLGEQSVFVLTLHRAGKHPEPQVQGNKIVVGKQTLELSNGIWRLGTFSPVKP